MNIAKYLAYLWGVFFATWAAVLLLGGAGCRAIAEAFVDPPSRSATVESAPFRGISYQREQRSEPRPMAIHVFTVDLTAPGIRLLVTPGEAEASLPLKARTTSEYLEEFDLQLAVNGSGFNPWFDLGLLYYPHSGNAVKPYGWAASQGTVYAEGSSTSNVLYLYKNNTASINIPFGEMYNAISGLPLLAAGGEARPHLGGSPEPRTAIGLTMDRRKLIIVVVDGRQPGYSEGATLDELAELMLEYNAFTALNLDGGGSSTLVVEGPNGEAQVVNSPIHQGIPGNERPVGNHLGIYAQRD